MGACHELQGRFFFAGIALPQQGKDCEVKIEQSLDSAGQLYMYTVVVRDLNNKKTTLFSFGESLVSVDKSRRGGFKNLEGFESTSAGLSVKVVNRGCIGSFIMQFCDDNTETLKLDAIANGIRVSVSQSVDSYKALWSSSKAICEIQ